MLNYFVIGRTAMQAFRMGMDLTGYNVANAHTPGYSRRRVELGTLSPALPTPGGWSGTGVDVMSVRRVRDPFIDSAMRREFGRLGSDDARAAVLTGLEPTFGEVDAAPLQQALSGLFDAFETLTVQADDPAAREHVLAAAEGLAEEMRRSDAALLEARRSADGRVRQTVGRINEIVTQLAQINRDMPQMESMGDEASDLRDQRDLLLDELSGLVGSRAVENEDGTVSVFLAETGDVLMTGTTPHPLRITETADGLAEVQISRGGEAVNLTNVLGGSGRLGGLLAVRDEQIVGYRATLDQLASTVITEINARHQAGFDLDGNAGLPLFEPDPPGAHPAAAMAVNAVVAQDPRRIAAASAPGEPANNENVLGILELRGEALGVLGGKTLAEYTGQLIASVGRDTAAADASAVASATIVESLELKRQRLSGVNLDEEAADLVRWQRSFEAAARFLQTVNEVSKVALNLGR